MEGRIIVELKRVTTSERWPKDDLQGRAETRDFGGVGVA